MTKLGFTGKGTDLSDNDLNWDNGLLGRCFFYSQPLVAAYVPPKNMLFREEYAVNKQITRLLKSNQLKYRSLFWHILTIYAFFQHIKA